MDTMDQFMFSTSLPHYPSVFKDESKLDLQYVPSRLPHRDLQLNLLNHFFRFAIEGPGKMAQRVLISGKIGTGKTVVSQRFGLNITKEAQSKGTNLHYVHINCRECKGSLFLIIQRPIVEFYPHFPKRGYTEEELLQMLIQVLDEKNAFLILTLDELEALIKAEGSDPLYKLTRVQEDRINAPRRLSLICILRETGYLESLDPSTRSTLQRNFIRMDKYSKPQLRDILKDRASIAFQYGAFSENLPELVADLAATEGGDARYAIDLLWRAGKYADASGSREVLPEHVREAIVNVYPTVEKNLISSLSIHQKMFLLGIARVFRQTQAAYASMGEVEEAYAVICEEHGQNRRGHTQLWKYVQELSALGIIGAKASSAGQRGKTTRISLLNVPAVTLEEDLSKNLEKGANNLHAD